MFMKSKDFFRSVLDLSKSEDLGKVRKILTRFLLKVNKPRIILSTLNKLLNDEMIECSIPVNTMFCIDKCGQIERWMLIHFTLKYTKENFVFMGDPKQLKPYKLIRCANKILNSFYQHYVYNHNYTNITLDISYRFNRDLSTFVSESFYSGSLMCGSGNFNCSGINNNGYYWFSEKHHESIEKSSSLLNRYKTNNVLYFVQMLQNNNIKMFDIEVHCFYTGQQDYLRTKLPKDINVVTVDQCQELKFEYTIVCTTSLKSTTFVDDNNRLCVALSRCKKGMYLILNKPLYIAKIKSFN
uniref:AAA_12 domain-containing protein n=1 Tax=Parastrongyloides trichosuri TaxID=131310 RepID=A0A0N4Z1K0_PARTI